MSTQPSLTTHTTQPYHHVEFCVNPIRTTPEDSHIILDECTKELTSITPKGVCRIPLEGENRGERRYYSFPSTSSSASEKNLSDRSLKSGLGPKVIKGAKFSPDGKWMGLMLGEVCTEIEFVSLEDNSTFIASSKKSRGNASIIFAFYWPHPNTLLYVTNQGIELYQFPKPKRNKELKLIKDHKTSVYMFHYSARHRILVLHIGGASMLPFYFKSGNIIKMPKFDLDLPSLPSTSTSILAAFSSSSTLPPIQPNEIAVYQLYNGIYCIHINSHRGSIELFQLTKQAVLRRGRLDLFTSGASHIHVIDNLLLIHNIESKVSLIFDIRGWARDMAGFPVASPLPLSAVPYNFKDDSSFSRSSSTASITPSLNSSNNNITNINSNNNNSINTNSNNISTPSDIELYTPNWKFFLPNFILDTVQGYCWEVGLNIDGIVLSLSDRARMVQFLQRRSGPRIKPVLLRELRAVVLEHEAMIVIAQIFDSLNLVLAAHLRANSAYAQQLEASKRKSRQTKDGSEASSNPSTSPIFPVSDTSGFPPLRKIALNEEYTLPSSDDPTYDDDAIKSESPTNRTLSTRFSNYPNNQVGLGFGIIGGSEEDDEDDDPQPSSSSQPSTSSDNKNARPANASVDELVVINQSDMYTHVFVPVEEKCDTVEGASSLDFKFVVAVITEYIRSLSFHHITVTPFLYELLINFLVRNGRFYQLHQFLQYHVVSDSQHVACQLLSLESTYPPAYQLALDMLKRLNTHDQIVEVLLTKKLILPALRFLRSHRGVRVPPARFLEATANSEDWTLYFTVFRFFEQRHELSYDDPQVEKWVKLFKEKFKDLPRETVNGNFNLSNANPLGASSNLF
eukprot:TRINITY_DN4383_c0_g1_i1.p1 TRINITY_DN4383_c0_g1~~TRINITY_DN4383_c0_g1_i1.p1  ORF type:complete len:901 (+),score=199.61 TRINITY_DN4383_c0_g1_i1:154-2703(+)